MTIEPSELGEAHFRLPPRIDTLEALRLGARLQDAAAQSSSFRVSASAVEEIGLAGLQLLALLKQALAREGGTLTLVDPSSALRGRIAEAGMAPLLLDIPSEQGDEIARHSLRFTDAALDYGREPIRALRRLREDGISVEPVLPEFPPSLGLIEPDRLLLHFNLWLPNTMSGGVLADALAEFGGDALLDAAPQSEIAVEPISSADLPVDQHNVKLERLMSDVEELMTRHAALAAHYPSLDQNVVAELQAMNAVLRSLQSHAIEAGLVPLDTLLQSPIANEAGRASSFPGSDIEIEPGVVQPLLPVLVELLARSGRGADGPCARATHGGMVIEMAITDGEAALSALDPALSLVRGRAVILNEGTASRLQIELPRSRSMLEALIVRAGSQLAAIPVDRTIEILRPELADLISVGPGAELLRFGGSYLPVVDLARALGPQGFAGETGATIALVVHADAGDFAIRVHEVTDHRQITIKGLDHIIPAGGAVIGLCFDAGGTALVLDIDTLRSAAFGRS